MPTDQRRRDDIAAAVAAYDHANPMTRCHAAPTRLLAGFLSKEPGSGVVPDTYWLHLPPVQP